MKSPNGKISLSGLAAGLLMLSIIGYIAMSEGAKEGALMAECVEGKLQSLNQYVSDRDVAYRIAVSTCSRYNRDGIVKIPLDEK
ncbi:hypothetical protein AL061_15090 [Pseudomonas syringae pv. syringae]|nr:hypothetical protein AL061_15090 [Pseudomonas syringae pv. syringae]